MRALLAIDGSRESDERAGDGGEPGLAARLPARDHHRRARRYRAARRTVDVRLYAPRPTSASGSATKAGGWSTRRPRWIRRPGLGVVGRVLEGRAASIIPEEAERTGAGARHRRGSRSRDARADAPRIRVRRGRRPRRTARSSWRAGRRPGASSSPPTARPTPSSAHGSWPSPGLSLRGRRASSTWSTCRPPGGSGRRRHRRDRRGVRVARGEAPGTRGRRGRRRGPAAPLGGDRGRRRGPPGPAARRDHRPGRIRGAPTSSSSGRAGTACSGG